MNEAENEEEMFENAPGDFFDPITSTLMRDPVILPASKVTVDRSTIARHLLRCSSNLQKTRHSLTPDLYAAIIQTLSTARLLQWKK